MIKIVLLNNSDGICGFNISGHSGSAEKGEDIICASVSSAAYMVANTITDVIKAKAEVQVSDGKMRFKLLLKSEESQNVLKGFYIHVKALSEQYPKNIKITFITEV